MGVFAQCKIIGLLVPGKIFKVFTIYGRGGHRGHETWTSYINLFVPHFHRDSTRNLTLIGQEISEKEIFEKLGPDSSGELNICKYPFWYASAPQIRFAFLLRSSI